MRKDLKSNNCIFSQNSEQILKTIIENDSPQLSETLLKNQTDRLAQNEVILAL